MSIPTSDLKHISSTVPTSHFSYKKSSRLEKAKNISSQLNVIGLTLTETISQVDKYIDDAILSNLSRITIIHGIGAGILKKGIQNHLKSNPRIANFRSGDYSEGGLGVTIIYLL